MCHQTKCCGCIPLRTGCLVIAILQILSAFAWFRFGLGYSYSVPMNLIDLAAGVCLLVGVILNNQNFLLVSATVVLIQLIVTIIVAVGLFASSGAGADVTTAAIAIFLAFVIIVLIRDINFFIVVWNFYNELQSGRRENIC